MLSARMLTDTSLTSDERVKQDIGSASAQAQMLLVALRNVIIPIAETVNGVKGEATDQISFGPEAEDLLAALQNFISSIIRSRSSQQGAPRADSQGSPDTRSSLSSQEGNTTTISNMEDYAFGSSSNSRLNVPSQEQSPLLASATSSEDTSDEPPQPLRLTKALNLLQHHVFNEMPTRLLCFEDDGSNIVLVDREKVYTHLAKRLRATFNESKLANDIMKLKLRYLHTEGRYVEQCSVLEMAEKDAIHHIIYEIAQYAILSHTWLRGEPGELTYDSSKEGPLNTRHPGSHKLVDFCKASAAHGSYFGWVDTVCINKASSSELDESIRSMYKWYSRANICIVYLARTLTLSNMDADPWFTRGWTLQELLAPHFIKFYDMNWKRLVNNLSNDKWDPHILRHIESATTITRKDMMSFRLAPISKKMKWAARREVTREEDRAYSLMGLFDVNMSIAYGEGADQAFFRLLKEILESSTARGDSFSQVIDIFNWAGEHEARWSVLLPSSPQAYLQSNTITQLRRRQSTAMMPLAPLSLTHLGLRITVVLLSAVPTSHRHKSPYCSIGDFHATVTIQPIAHDIPKRYHLLDVAIQDFPKRALIYDESGTNSYNRLPSQRMAFGILNCEGNETAICIPKNCFAVAILVDGNSRSITPFGPKDKIPTKKPIVFQLNKVHWRGETENTGPYHMIGRKELACHGMQVLSVIL